MGGLVVDGKMAFPNAIVRTGKHDADCWLSEENMKKAPKDSQGFFQGAMTSLNEIGRAHV